MKIKHVIIKKPGKDNDFIYKILAYHNSVKKEKLLLTSLSGT